MHIIPVTHKGFMHYTGYYKVLLILILQFILQTPTERAGHQQHKGPNKVDCPPPPPKKKR